jgi:DNA-binding NtrC family response regulator
MTAFLVLGNFDPLLFKDHPTTLQIADQLAAAGLRTVRLHDLERAAIYNALAASDGNKTRAAKSLGFSVRTLQRKLKVWDSMNKRQPRAVDKGTTCRSQPQIPGRLA